jgi:hypothetical protein
MKQEDNMLPYEKPKIEKQTKVDFAMEIFREGLLVKGFAEKVIMECKQCSSCHSCR